MTTDAVRVRAAVCRAVGEPLTIEEISLKPCAVGEVRVVVDAVAICHSDLAYIDGHWAGALPAVFGHEAVGRVAECGSDVDLAIGARVVITLIRHCGSCRQCQSGHPAACSTAATLGPHSPIHTSSGEPVERGLRCAAFAEQVVVHHSQLVEIDERAGDAAAALLACGVITGVGAVLNTDVVAPDDSVVVVGCGGVGLNVIQGAALAGAHPIIAVDPEPTKATIAKRLGATQVCSPADAAAVVAAATDGHMADHVFVATGAPPALRSASDLLGVGGAIVIVGMPPDGTTMEIDPSSLAGAGQRILGSKMGSSDHHADVPTYLDHHRDGRLELEGLVSGTFALDEINLALDGVRSGTALRNVILMGARDEDR